MQSRILYIDGFNLFQANYRSNIALDTNGEPIGGFIGVLQQLRGLIYKFSPQKVLMVFDGPDAGLRRRSLYSGYKSKRRAKKRCATVKLGDDLIQTDNESEQLEKLFNALRVLPVQLISVPFYEADDVISYLVARNPEYNNIIVSNDKDYLQRITETTHVYQFTKKKLMDLKKVEEEFEINPKNILYYRSIVGDSSDELIGIKGLGKDIINKISAFKERAFDSFGDFWSEIESLEEGKSKKIKLLKENQQQALLMYQLMRLDETSLNQRAINLVRSQLDEQLDKPFSSIGFKIFCTKNKLNIQLKDPDSFLSGFFALKRKIEINT